MLTIALLGAGRIGRIHGGNVAAPPARAAGGGRRCRCRARRKPLAAATGAKVATIEAILADKAIDAVLICTPTDTHADLIERAVKAGKAVFCEKPVDLDAGAHRKCLKVVRDGQGHADDRLQPPLRPELRRVRRRLDAARSATSNWSRSCRATRRRRRSPTSRARAGCSAT